LKLVEIRSYRLRPGQGPAFARLFHDEALPLLRRFEIDVVAFGWAAEDSETAFLIRSFTDRAERETRELAFYSSDAWRQGPRKRILACIETYVDTLLTLDECTVDGLRRVGTGP
jgi:hypothetical protein